MNVTTRQQLWKDMGGNVVEKQAELAGTYDMPNSPPGTKRVDQGKEKAVIKTAAAQGMTEDDFLKLAFSSEGSSKSAPSLETNENEALTAENIKAQPQAKALKPTVDVSGREAPKPVLQKAASRYALPMLGKYPLDSYEQVKQASAYFDEWQVRMSPEMRREYCQNMVKRATELSIPVSALAERYGSSSYAPPHQIKIALDARRSVLASEEQRDMLDKIAEARPGMLPENFAVTLSEFDQMAGLSEFYGGDVPDPYFSTFAKVGTAGVKQESEEDPEGAILLGNEYLPKRKLILFSKTGKDVMSARFGEELADAFIKDPVSILKSLPRDQQLVVMRLASSVDAQFQSATKS